MSSKHTPGPWEMVPREQTIRTADAYDKDGWATYVVGFNVWATDGERPIVGPNGIPALEAGEANARLIAAAPELLEAVLEALKYANEEGISSARFPRVQLEAALAKAGGAS